MRLESSVGSNCSSFISPLPSLRCSTLKVGSFLGQAHQLPLTVITACSKSIDPESWRKRAAEARALADITADANAKRSLLEIADAYDALAKPPS